MDRRKFIKNAGAGTVMAGGALSASSQALAQSSGLKGIKNILFLLSDQHRQDSLGCYGNDIVQTPNIDRLAKNGIRFDNCYTPAPVCTPARMSMQCGLWPHNHELIFNTARVRYEGGRQDPKQSIRFFSEDLRDKGWQNAHIGKWHIGTEANKPVDRGYDDFPFHPDYGYPRNHPHYVEYLKKQGVDGFNLLSQRKDPTEYRSYAGLQEGPQSASIPAYLASQTIDAIKDYTKNDKPFFASCNFWGPHAPYNITKKHLEMYRGADIKPWPNYYADLSDKPGIIKRYGEYWKNGWFNEKDMSEMIGEYYGYISLIDEEIGRILKTLEETGELDSTLIVYSSDHGSSVGSYRFWDKGFGMYDCITRVPLVISHPSIKPGASEAFVTLMDLMPTFLEAAGCTVPDNLDGSSLTPILDGSKKAIRENHIITEHHGHQMPFWQRMVRTPEFKYIYNPMSRDEFYDLEKDPWETKNILGHANKDQLAWSKETLLEWMKETTDPCLFWARPMLTQ